MPTLLSSFVGLAMLLGGAELLVRGASRLAAALGLSPLVIGLTVVAFGTSAPEFAVSAQASYAGQPDLLLGNLIGSNIANVLLILGVASLVAPLVVAQQIVRLEAPLGIGIAVLVWLLALDGVIGRFDGALLFGGLLLYLVWSIRKERKAPPSVQEEYATALDLPQEEPEEVSKGGRIALNLGLLVTGLVILVVGADWLVEGAVALARAFGVSELVIGLTVIAVGTSLPEVATSIIAGLRGGRDIAVGNVMGSNIFNLLGVLGLAALVAPHGVPVDPEVLRFELPVMIAVSVACLPIFFHGYRIARWEGGFLLAHYIAFTTYIVLSATASPSLERYTWVMMAFVFPLTITTLVVILVRGFRRSKRGDAPPVA